MAQTADLMGFGTPGPVADLLGTNAPASLTAAGTTSTDAKVVATGQDFIILTGTGSDGIRLPAGAGIGVEYYITCIAGGAKVYPHTGGALNGGTTDAGITVATAKAAIAKRYSSTGWLFNLSA
jgi:hypothetical protein